MKEWFISYSAPTKSVVDLVLLIFTFTESNSIYLNCSEICHNLIYQVMMLRDSKVRCFPYHQSNT